MYPTRYIDPEAVGCLVAQTVRCGKDRCRCRRGEPHGPYWYLAYRWWDADSGTWRQRKRYVRPGELETTRARLAKAKAADRAVMGLFGRSRTLRGVVSDLLIRLDPAALLGRAAMNQRDAAPAAQADDDTRGTKTGTGSGAQRRCLSSFSHEDTDADTSDNTLGASADKALRSPSPFSHAPAAANAAPDSKRVDRDAIRARQRREDSELAAQGRQARERLVERMAHERDFAFLDGRTARSPEMFSHIFETADADYRSGEFFLRELSLFKEVAPRLAITVFELRQQWIEQYDLRSVAELMLLDQAMLAYFHLVRTNKEIGKMFSLLDDTLYWAEYPAWRFSENGAEERFPHTHHPNAGKEHVQTLQDMLVPLLERFNKMFLRNLGAMRELKAKPIEIHIRRSAEVHLPPAPFSPDQ